MSFIKKQSVGFYFAALAVIAAVVATVFYLINCNTAYFSNLGVNAVIVGCLIVAIVLELVYIIGYNKVCRLHTVPMPTRYAALPFPAAS